MKKKTKKITKIIPKRLPNKVKDEEVELHQIKPKFPSGIGAHYLSIY